MMQRIRLDVASERIPVAAAAGRDFIGFTGHAMPDFDCELATVTWNAGRQCSEIIYTPPAGEAAYIAEGIARMVAVRSRRRDVQTGHLRLAVEEWWRLTKLNFAPMFDGCRRREVGHGWLDLTLALADWLWTPDCEILIDDFADRDGELRVDMVGYDEEDFARVTAFELLSRHVCSTCGAPGRIYDTDAIFAAGVYCEVHAPSRG